MTEKSTVKDLLQQCLEKFSLQDMLSVLSYFGIFESRNGGSVDGVLSLETFVLDVIQSWVDGKVDQTAKFLFMIRLYMPCLWGYQHKDVIAFKLSKPKNVLSNETYFDEAEITDPNCMHLQFIQAVYNIITGRYPTTPEEALELGAIHFLNKFNEFKPSNHVVGFLGQRIVEFIPIKHLKGGSMSLEEWEQQLMDRAAAMSKNGETVNGTVYYFKRNGHPITAERRYMEIVYSMANYFGNSFYRVTQRSTRLLPEVLYVGIYHLGINIYDKSKKYIRSFHIEEIYRWGFKPNTMFYFEISPENDLQTGTLEFDTVEGKVMSDLLTDYALAFLNEREQEDDRHDKMKQGKYDVAATTAAARRASATTAAADKIAARHASGTNSSSSAAANKAPPPTPKNGAPPAPATPPPAPAGSRLSISQKLKTLSATEKAKQHAAIVKIQALYRGFKIRNDWDREVAATLIQSVFRGYRARVRLSAMIEQMINAGQL